MNPSTGKELDFNVEALDVIRFARTDEPHDTWEQWQNAIVNGLLRAYNAGQDSVARADSKETKQPGYTPLDERFED